MRIRRQRVRRFDEPRHDQYADLEIIRVRIRRRARKMAETTIGITARERPTGRPFDGHLTFSAPVSELSPSEHGVKRTVPIPRGEVEQPTAVGFLIVQP